LALPPPAQPRGQGKGARDPAGIAEAGGAGKTQAPVRRVLTALTTLTPPTLHPPPLASLPRSASPPPHPHPACGPLPPPSPPSPPPASRAPTPQLRTAPSRPLRLQLSRRQAPHLTARREAAKIAGRTTCATTRVWTHHSAAGSGPSPQPLTPTSPRLPRNTVARHGAPHPQLRSCRGSSARSRIGRSADQACHGPTAREHLSAPHSSTAPAPEGPAAASATDIQALATPA